MFILDISTKLVSMAFAPLFWIFDETRKADEKPTLENFNKCYHKKCSKNQKPGELEKRLLLELLGGLGFIGGALLSLYGYAKKSKLFKIIGGAFTLSGLGSFITGCIKYFTLGINEIGKINNSENKEKKKDTNKTTPKPSGTALTIYSGSQDKKPTTGSLPPECFINPTYIQQIQRILNGVINKLNEQLKKNKNLWGDPSIETAMFIFANPTVFVAYRAMKDFYGLGDEQLIAGSNEEQQFYEDTSKARTEYYNSQFSGHDASIEYRKEIDRLNELVSEYNLSCGPSEAKLNQVKEDLTDDEIKKIYRKLAFKFHPDRNPGDDKEAEIKFKDATKAYDLICEYRERKMGKIK